MDTARRIEEASEHEKSKVVMRRRKKRGKECGIVHEMDDE